MAIVEIFSNMAQRFYLNALKCRTLINSMTKVVI